MLFSTLSCSYLLTLVPDGMRGIKNIFFEKAAAAVLASCVRQWQRMFHSDLYMCICIYVRILHCIQCIYLHTLWYACVTGTCIIIIPLQVCTFGSQYIFLGSRLGNSLLLKYSNKPPRGQCPLLCVFVCVCVCVCVCRVRVRMCVCE